MTVYIDLVFMINLFFDFLLLTCVKLILKRYIKIYRIILGAIFGSLSTFLLFIKINSLELFAFKIIISLIMLLVTFGYKNIRYYFKNFITLYMVSCVLGGFLYFLNNSFSYKREGLVFFYKGISINIIFMIILTPIIVYIYIKESRVLKDEYSNYYEVTMVNDSNKTIKFNGYLDTGNNLIDPISKKRVILVNKNLIDNFVNIRSPIYVPIKTVNKSSLLECFKVKEIYINNRLINNVLVGTIDSKLYLDNIDCLLNNKLKGEII